MTDALVEAVARAILETDPTCDFDACKVRVETNPHSNDAGWWASLHRQARNALAAIEASGTHRVLAIYTGGDADQAPPPPVRPRTEDA